MDVLAKLRANLESEATTSVDLITGCIDKINDPAGEGARTFITTNLDEALKTAREIDDLRRSGKAPSPLAGIPVSIKDLFDVKGEVTKAGSKVLTNHPPATSDAEIISRLRRAGLIIMGRTNMTEFAYSGLGLNPHYGTPLNPYNRAEKHIPGGSSAGAVVSVTDGMAAIGIGTDTGGSCRIPASFCGIVGYKPTARRVPLAGTYPLSSSFDSIGSLGNSVTCCALMDAILSGENYTKPPHLTASDLKIGILKNIVLEDMDDAVASTFERAITKLTSAGITCKDVVLEELNNLPSLNTRGGIVAAEAYATYEGLLLANEHEFDPRVSVRIKKALEQRPDEYEELLETRRRYISRANEQTNTFDVLIFPTTPTTAPKLADLKNEEAYGKANLLALRNSTIVNFLDRCAITLPISQPGTAPVGLTLMGETMSDHKLFSIATAIEKIFNQ